MGFEGNIPMHVAVIVPVYNVECHVRQCLDTLLARTCLREEIVFADDDSADLSGAILFARR